MALLFYISHSARQMMRYHRSLLMNHLANVSTPSSSTENKTDLIQSNSSTNKSMVQQFVPPEPWEDPWAHALGPPKPPAQFTKNVVESKEEFKWVLRLLPKEAIPEVPNHEKYPTPSGWKPPKLPAPDLPYYVRRNRHHLFPLHLECRRDDLDTNTLEYNYVEVVIMKNIDGDVFACEEDLRSYLEEKLRKKVATHVNEMQGKIRVKGADRSLLEQFLMDKGF